MEDFLGYSRDVKPNGQIMTGEMATLTVGGDKSSLVQQVSAVYQQTATPKFEVGSPTLYWLTGQPSGTVAFGRIVGCNGFLSGMGALKNSCGTLIPLQIGSDGTGGCASAQCGGGNPLTFDGGVVQQINISFNAGTLEVTEGATIMVASMK